MPKEAHITPLIRAVDLGGGAAVWARELMGFKPDVPRIDGAGYVRRAGFDISDTVKTVLDGYLSDGQ